MFCGHDVLVYATMPLASHAGALVPVSLHGSAPGRQRYHDQGQWTSNGNENPPPNHASLVGNLCSERARWWTPPYKAHVSRSRCVTARVCRVLCVRESDCMMPRVPVLGGASSCTHRTGHIFVRIPVAYGQCAEQHVERKPLSRTNPQPA